MNKIPSSEFRIPSSYFRISQGGLMQKLTVQKADGQVIKALVIRSFYTLNAGELYLHKGGVYGYKDGAPVRTWDEIERIIQDKDALEKARRWWKAEGETLARDFYRERPLPPEQREYYYLRVPAGKPIPKKIQNGLDWTALGFERKPEWWGEADNIQLGDFVYVKEPDPEPESDEKMVDPGEL